MKRRNPIKPSDPNASSAIEAPASGTLVGGVGGIGPVAITVNEAAEAIASIMQIVEIFFIDKYRRETTIVTLRR